MPNRRILMSALLAGLFVLAWAGAEVQAGQWVDADGVLLDTPAEGAVPVELQLSVAPPEAEVDAVNWYARAAWPLAPRGRCMSGVEYWPDSSFLYCVGGQGAGANPRYPDLLRYDPLTNTWTTLAALATGTSNMHAAWWTDDGVGLDSSGLFVTGTYNPTTNTVWYWCKATNTWTALTTYPITTMSNGTMCAVVGDSLFMQQRYSPQFQCYSIRQGTWYTRPDPPAVAYYGSMCSYAGKVWQQGGYANGANFHVYNPQTGAWTSLPLCPSTCGGNSPHIAGFAGRVWVWGGANGWTGKTGCAYYDTLAGIWTTETNMPVQRCGGFFGALDSAGVFGMHLACGFSTGATAPQADHWRGLPDLPAEVWVVVPNGGESWGVGTSQTIECKHRFGPAVTDSVLVSRDGGSNWEFLFNAAAASSHNWTVTGPATTQARIRIVAINAYGTGTDDSDADFAITQAGNPDMGVDAIVAPVGTYDTMEVFAPEVTVTNHGDVDATYDATFRVWDPTDALVYDSTLTGQFLAQGNTINLTFPDGMTNLNEGTWVTRCSVYVSGDVDNSNDTLPGSFDVMTGPTCLPGWHETSSHVPKTPTDKPVKQGGWLAYQGTTDAESPIYVHKGYKTTDFYAYYPTGDSWVTLTGMPYSTHPNEKWARKPPYKGSKGIQVGDVIYVTQGNNTLGFWSYHPDGDSWHVEDDVPVGPDGKKVKGGTDMTYVPAFGAYDDYVYLVKGYRSEFYRFNLSTKTWGAALEQIPTGARGKMDKGSWCSYNHGETGGGHLIYILKSKYGEFYAYDIESSSYTTLASMPLRGWHSGKIKDKKKPKDGGCGSYWDGHVYALKGGNTQQFFQYFPAGDSWHELDTLPNNGSTGKKKRVKYGADLVSMGNGCFYALKGNKTSEMWCYGVGTTPFAGLRPERSGVMAGVTKARGLGVSISPNPLAAGFATLRYSLAKPGPAVVSVFDVAGRSVARQSVAANRTGAVNLDLRKLAAGIYLVRLDASDYSSTHKLVVQH